MSLLPGLIMAPIAGTLGDRMDRRKIVIGIQTFIGGVFRSCLLCWWDSNS